jgi:hypothetical protein
MRALLVCTIALGLAIPSAAAPTAYGEIHVTDRAIDPASPTLRDDLQASRITSVARTGDAWRFHILVLGRQRERAAATVELVVFVWDTPQRKRVVHVAPIRLPKPPPGVSAFSAVVELRESDGITPGAYNLAIAAPASDRGQRHARGVIELR